MTVRVLKGEGADIIGQYVGFCKVFNLAVKKHGATEEAVQETIRICKDKNLLRDYLTSHETEVISIMALLFSDKFIKEAWANEIREEAREEAMEEGIEKGRKEFARETVLRMHKIGMPQLQIAECLGYEPAEVDRLVRSAD